MYIILSFVETTLIFSPLHSRLASYEVFADFVPEPFITLLPPPPQPNFAYAEDEDGEY